MPTDVNKVFKTKCYKLKCVYGLLQTILYTHNVPKKHAQ